MEYKFLLAMLTCISLARCEETFENSTNLCTERCKCSLLDDNSTLYLDCTGTQMHHALANWPKHPRKLVAIFRDNDIVTLEKMPGSSAEHVQLIFSHCNIAYLDSGLFESCMNVKYLDLSHNNIERDQLSSAVFKGPYNNTAYEPIALEYLDLSYNKIHSLPKNLFEHTPRLRQLNLEGNGLRIIDRQTCLGLSRAVEMQVLNLANNSLTEVPSDAIKHFPNLTEINLSYNELDFVPQSLGFVAESLQVLNISHNTIVELGRESFEGLERLLEIHADHLDLLERITANTFANLENLVVLKLCHNGKLEEIGEEAFGPLGGLEEVYLNDNSLVSLYPSSLPWSQLKKIDISNNRFMCNCDLLNITNQLRISVKRETNPMCLNRRSYQSTEIYSLSEETCDASPLRRKKNSYQVYGSARVMKITLTCLIVVLIIAATVAFWLGYSRWSAYRRSLSYPFPNQIIYSPVSTVEFPRY